MPPPIRKRSFWQNIWSFRERAAGPARPLRIEELEAKAAASTLTGFDTPFVDTYNVGQPTLPMGVAHADHSLCNDSAGEGHRLAA